MISLVKTLANFAVAYFLVTVTSSESRLYHYSNAAPLFKRAQQFIQTRFRTRHQPEEIPSNRDPGPGYATRSWRGERASESAIPHTKGRNSYPGYSAHFSITSISITSSTSVPYCDVLPGYRDR
eukprot:2374463-Rhodomonas_salina.3